MDCKEYIYFSWLLVGIVNIFLILLCCSVCRVNWSWVFGIMNIGEGGFNEIVFVIVRVMICDKFLKFGFIKCVVIFFWFVLIFWIIYKFDLSFCVKIKVNVNE